MTTGTRRLELLPYAVPGIGTVRLGRLFIKTWDGVDSISASTPRSSFPRKDHIRPKARSKRSFPDNPYTMHVEDTNFDGFWCQVAGSGYNFYTKNVQWGSGLSAKSYDSSKELKLIAKLRERIYGSGFNPAVFIAEGRQALGMIGNSATRISSGLARLKAGDGHGVCEALGIEPQKGFIRDVAALRRSVSSLWLEVQYGWLPLLSDAEQGAQYLARALVERTSSRTTVRKTWFEERSGTVLDEYGSAFTRRIDIHELSITAKNWSAAPVYQPNLFTVAEVAWEKLPYSFVFDWFYPVGSLLNALKTREDIQGTFITSRKTTSIGLDWKVGPGFVSPPIPYLNLPDKKIWVDFQREVSGAIQIPTLASLVDDDMLTYKSWRHAANAVALLSQRKLKDYANALGSSHATG